VFRLEFSTLSLSFRVSLHRGVRRFTPCSVSAFHPLLSRTADDNFFSLFWSCVNYLSLGRARRTTGCRRPPISGEHRFLRFVCPCESAAGRYPRPAYNSLFPGVSPPPFVRMRSLAVFAGSLPHLRLPSLRVEIFDFPTRPLVLCLIRIPPFTIVVR